MLIQGEERREGRNNLDLGSILDHITRRREYESRPQIKGKGTKEENDEIRLICVKQLAATQSKNKSNCIEKNPDSYILYMYMYTYYYYFLSVKITFCSSKVVSQTSP